MSKILNHARVIGSEINMRREAIHLELKKVKLTHSVGSSEFCEKFSILHLAILELLCSSILVLFSQLDDFLSCISISIPILPFLISFAFLGAS